MRQYATIIFSIWLIILPLIPFLSIGIFRDSIGVFPTIVLSFLLLGITMYRKQRNLVDVQLHISIVDILVVVLIIYTVTRLFVRETKIEIDEMAIFKVIMLCIVYVCIRVFSVVSVILKGIVIGSLLQATIIIFQKLGYIESRHWLFDVTGTFSNPGQVAGYIAIGIVITLSMYFRKLEKCSRNNNVWYSIFIVLQIISLYYADSRASFIAILVGMLFIENQRIKYILRKHRRLFIPILLLLIVGGGIALFMYRPDSIKARILIWRISCDMIADKPIWGHGIGDFDKTYMLYQANYFIKYPDSQFAFVADNVNVPYNELLRITIEWGGVGALLFLILFFKLFVYHSNNSEDMIVKGALIVLSTFSIFSYPGDILPLLLLFPILIGLIESRQCFSFGFSRRYMKALQFVFIIGGFVCLKTMLFYGRVSSQTKKIMIGDSSILLKQEIVTQLLPNATFATFYAHCLDQKNEMISDTLIAYLPPTCENFCYLGDFYLKGKLYDEAEDYYRKASYMVPTRLTPNYKLWCLYLLTGDTIKAVRKAKDIQKQKMKIENSLTFKIKSEIGYFLSSVP